MKGFGSRLSERPLPWILKDSYCRKYQVSWSNYLASKLQILCTFLCHFLCPNLLGHEELPQLGNLLF